MNKIKLLFCAAVLFTGCALSDFSDYENHDLLSLNQEMSLTSKQVYYYYSGEKLFLTQRKDLLYIQFDDVYAKKRITTELNKDYSFQNWSPYGKSISEDSDFSVIQLNSELLSDAKLEKIKALDGVAHLSNVTIYEEENKISAVTNKFFAKLKKETSYAKLLELTDKLSCEVKPWREDDRIYSISLPKSVSHKTIEYSSMFYETGLFEYCSPSFNYIFASLDSQDPYYDVQWGLHGSGPSNQQYAGINIEQAWTITQGDDDIVVAVIDDGVDIYHPDLQSQALPGYDVFTASPGTPNAGDNHGTPVAGIIAAKQNNNIGISGVAPNCKILPVRYGSGPNDEYCAESIDWAWENGEADVINCSWSFSNPTDLTNHAIFRATSRGRNGKGSVVVFSAGNNGGPVCYPSRVHYVLAVGAHNTSGIRLPASNYGGELDVVAPGENILSTDRQGASGFNNQTTVSPDFHDDDYTYFQQTSAAAPHVSGIAALILSKYPNLDEDQVRRAIELSCTRPSVYTYQLDDRYPAALRNNEVGYGRVNAYAALLKAAEFNQQNIQNIQPGIDFIITNNSSYTVDQISIVLTGDTGAQYETLISCDPGGVLPGEVLGFPVYRGEDIVAMPGTLITDIEMQLWAETPGYSGNVRIGTAIDNNLPTFYYDFAFGSGDTYTFTLPDTTVPDMSRRTLYVNIINPY